MSDMLEYTKRYIKDFYVNEEWVDKPVLNYGNKEVSKESIEFLRELFIFFIESSFLSNESKIYIKSRASSVRQAIEEYNLILDDEDKININTAQSKIQYDKRKINRSLEDNMILNAMIYPDKFIRAYREDLMVLYPKYMKVKEYRDSTVLRLDQNVVVNDISDKDYNDLLKVLSIYSKETISKVEKGEQLLNNDMIGYFNYITNAPLLDDIGKVRLNEVREILGL